MKIWLFAVMMLSATAAVAQSVAPPAPAIEALPQLRDRGEDVITLLNGGGDPATLFTPEFRAAVADSQIRQLSAQLATSMGKALGIERLDIVTPAGAHLQIAYERGTMVADLAIEETAPFRIRGLLIKGTSSSETSVAAVITTLSALPGATNFAIMRLDDHGPALIAGHAPDTALGIGSTFKLVILAELVRATNAGERTWDDQVTLNGAPLPGGAYAASPAGTKVSIRELATKMISVSDNSATDILLALVGRERAEAIMPESAGHRLNATARFCPRSTCSSSRPLLAGH